MNCMKCGRDIADDHVFCPECLEVMARYPVKPGTAVQLPHKPDVPLVKKMQVKRRQPPTPEEQVQKLKKQVRRLAISLIVTLALLLAALYPATKYLLGDVIPLPGQNYSTFTEPTTTTEP